MATSQLQRKMSRAISDNFGGYTIRENYRPCWMTATDGARLELDFYIEELKVAIEVQGEQHYRYIEFMHGDYAGWLKRQSYDLEKKSICSERNILLLEVSEERDFPGVIEKMYSMEMVVIKRPPIDRSIVIKAHGMHYKQAQRAIKLNIRKIKKQMDNPNQPNNIDRRIQRIQMLADTFGIELRKFGVLEQHDEQSR